MTNPKHTDTSRSGDLVAAMKDQLESWEFEDPRESWWKWQHQYAQAADRIEALEAENERLRGALSNLINAYTANVDTYRLDDGFYTDPETEDEVIEARAALGEK